MTAPLYRAPPPGALLVAPLDVLTAVFHRPSGITHLLAEPAPQLLDALAEGAASLDTLVMRLSARFDLPDLDQAALRARLDELVVAGLVERIVRP